MYFHDDEYYMDRLPPIARAMLHAYEEALDCIGERSGVAYDRLAPAPTVFASRQALIEGLDEDLSHRSVKVYGRFGNVLEYNMGDLAIKMAHRGDFDEYVR